MGIVQNLKKRVPSTQSLPSLADLSSSADKLAPRVGFFRRRIRLNGNSTLSVPLSLVLLLPCMVIIVICVLFLRHPTHTGRRLMPAGPPPAIRCVWVPDRDSRRMEMLTVIM